MMVSEEQCVMMTVQFFYYIIGFYNIFLLFIYFSLCSFKGCTKDKTSS